MYIFSVEFVKLKFFNTKKTTKKSFFYQFLRKGSGYINVDPNLVAGNIDIPLESLQTVSVLTKCLGPFSSWKSKLQVAKECGYNMVHFTPIQV